MICDRPICVFLVVLLAGACHGGAAASTAARQGDGGGAAVPVELAEVGLRDVPVIISGPGRTKSSESHDVRAPFDGVLLDLLVEDGDRVRRRQVLGWLVSSDSEAALVGARAMVLAARTPQQRRDAERALALAKRGMVKTALRAPERGIVLSHQADEGGRLVANQTVVTIVAFDAIVFIADLAQADLARVHPGQPALIDMAADRQPRRANVHALLPGGSATDLTAPVRLDFAPRERPRELNLFGTAHVTVATHAGALVVPAAAVLRNDVSGLSRVAEVDATDHVHWVEVKVGLSVGDLVELVGTPLAPGARVVVRGQVGLADGAQVRVAP